jgi:uncharacterized protein (TIGR00725 family)
VIERAVRRRPIVAVIGAANASAAAEESAREIGRGIVDRGFRLVTGGLGGVMRAASEGARSSDRYREGDIVGIVPGADPGDANVFVDIVVPTNMGIARNVLVVASASAVVAIGGGAGTLSEIAVAWQLAKPIVALDVEGWSRRLQRAKLDDRRAEAVVAARDAGQALDWLSNLLDSSH